MQLFSARLRLKKTVDQESFMTLIKEWNDTQFYEENRIPGLEYHGESDVTFGNNDLWLSVREYAKENILAVRYEKAEADGTVWDTDYVMNFETSSLAVRLERSYHEQALRVDARFSAPYFISLLIRKGYVDDDGVLPVTDEPILLEEDRIPLLARIMNREVTLNLPVLYISRTYYDEDPVDLKKTARQLKGIAHVLAEKSVFDNQRIREACAGQNAYYGAADLFFPNSDLQPLRFFYHAEAGEDAQMRDKIIRKVIEYSGSILLDPLETWNGVSHAVLLEEMEKQAAMLSQAESEKQDAVQEMEDVYSTFGRDLEKLRKQVEELSRQSADREYETQKLREKLRQSDQVPVLISGEEEEFFEGEIREMVLDALNEKLANLPPESRRAHVLKDLIGKNDYRKIHQQRAEKIKTMFKDYRVMSSKMEQELNALGFVLSDDNKHYRLSYYGDARYKTTIAKTGSDHREGRNIAALISRMFM